MRDRRAELRHLLNEWDFIGVFDEETNVDEYDCMIGPLLARLADGADSDDIRALLDAEVTGHFGLSDGAVETSATAERLTAWWRTTT
ncbi:hypothetical protein [Phytohabitans suffuscus]|uniref:CdiI immunity protein domain-containing protein n=1 Tax=Phytohabitans suffuscus TaxID=624315 RepID=A0A6F8YTB5_9ACTN|nr:hypothetical protein [Phytohabitans suffuscus]BCB89296.1 hypothetical protein Psuf_066090 [Phytohabitans suffuscus]